MACVFFEKTKSIFRNILEHGDELVAVAKKETWARRHFLSVFRWVCGVGSRLGHPDTKKRLYGRLNAFLESDYKIS